MKDLLPAGSVVTIQGTTKKMMIIGILQMQKDTGKLFNHESINDVVFTGYTNPERDGFMKLMSLAYEKTMAEQQAKESEPAGDTPAGEN